MQIIPPLQDKKIDEGIFISEYGVPHWCDFFWLYDEAIKNANDNDILIELGTYFGGSVTYLAAKAREAGRKFRIYGVDINPELTRLSVEYLNLDVNVIQSDAGDFSKCFGLRSVFMVFLDASHEYEKTLIALNSWLPKMKRGGIFGGHDYGNHNYPGVKKAVDEFAKCNSLEFKSVGGTYVFDLWH
jgi:cephalosporin hydroxylase